MLAETEKIESLTDLLKIIAGFSSNINFHHHIRLWYRGQSDETWDLKPGVYRPDFNVTTEPQRIEKEQQMFQDFRVQSASLLSGHTSNEELYFLQQHYKMPTRLMDWSYSPVTALYFAVSGSQAKDGALYMMDAYQLALSQNVYNDPDGVKGTPTSSFPGFIKSVEAISHWRGLSFLPNYILPVRPYFTDKRITLQKSCFTFHVPQHPILTTTHNSTLKKFLIPMSSKERLKSELSLLGVNDFTTFGDMESLARTLIESHYPPH